MLEEGLVNAATIDAIAKETFGTGMGPFELMNVTGVPIAFHASTTIGQAYGLMYAPPARLRNQTALGQPWSLDGGIDPTVGEPVAGRLLAITFLVAATLVDEGIGTREDTDIGARVGLRWPKGPFELMNRHGTTRALDAVSPLAARWNLPVPPSLADAGRTNRPFTMSLVRTHATGRSQDRPLHESGAVPRHESGVGGVTTITVDRPDTMKPSTKQSSRNCARRFSAPPTTRRPRAS